MNVEKEGLGLWIPHSTGIDDESESESEEEEEKVKDAEENEEEPDEVDSDSDNDEDENEDDGKPISRRFKALVVEGGEDEDSED